MSRARYRAALFDFDDTIFDHQFHRRAGLAAIRDTIPALVNAGVEEIERVHDLYLQRTHRALLANELTLPQARVRRLRATLSDFGYLASDEEIDAAEAAYRQAYNRDWRVVPGARELLRRVRELGMAIAIVTNARVAEQEAKLDALGLRSAVDRMFVSEAVGAAKPERAFFTHVLDRLSVSCGECVVMGDLWETDVRGALDSGIDAIWLNRYKRANPPTPRVAQIASLEPVDEVIRLFY